MVFLLRKLRHVARVLALLNVGGQEGEYSSFEYPPRVSLRSIKRGLCGLRLVCSDRRWHRAKTLKEFSDLKCEGRPLLLGICYRLGWAATCIYFVKNQMLGWFFCIDACPFIRFLGFEWWFFALQKFKAGIHGAAVKAFVTVCMDRTGTDCSCSGFLAP